MTRGDTPEFTSFSYSVPGPAGTTAVLVITFKTGEYCRYGPLCVDL